MNKGIQKLKINRAKVESDREGFLIEYSKDKNVLHIGCVGTRDIKSKESFHEKLFSVSSNCIGLDINSQGIKDLKSKNTEFKIIEKSAEDLTDNDIEGENIDLIILGEVLEHIGNPEKTLKAIANLKNKPEIIITVPNAFGWRNFISMFLSHKEITRLDHYCYYSFTTLNTLINDCGLKMKDNLYYSLLTDRNIISKSIKKLIFNKLILSLRPGLSEGIIFICEKQK